MTPDARLLLAKAARTDVLVYPGDPKWPLVTELQRAGCMHLDWGGARIAKLVLTPKGRDVAREPSDA